MLNCIQLGGCFRFEGDGYKMDISVKTWLVHEEMVGMVQIVGKVSTQLVGGQLGVWASSSA